MRVGEWAQKLSNDPRHNGHNPSAPTTGSRERGTDATRNTGRSGCQKTLARRSARREERVTVQDPIQKQDGDEMAQGGGGRVTCDLSMWCVVRGGETNGVPVVTNVGLQHDAAGAKRGDSPNSAQLFGCAFLSTLRRRARSEVL